MINSKNEGESNYYYPSGHLWVKDHYIKGVRNGEYKEWYTNGNKNSTFV